MRYLTKGVSETPIFFLLVCRGRVFHKAPLVYTTLFPECCVFSC
jgi:hypothetical protein